MNFYSILRLRQEISIKMTFIPKRTEKDFFTFLLFINFAYGRGIVKIAVSSPIATVERDSNPLWVADLLDKGYWDKGHSSLRRTFGFFGGSFQIHYGYGEWCRIYHFRRGSYQDDWFRHDSCNSGCNDLGIWCVRQDGDFLQGDSFWRDYIFCRSFLRNLSYPCNLQDHPGSKVGDYKIIRVTVERAGIRQINYTNRGAVSPPINRGFGHLPIPSVFHMRVGLSPGRGESWALWLRATLWKYSTESWYKCNRRIKRSSLNFRRTFLNQWYGME